MPVTMRINGTVAYKDNSVKSFYTVIDGQGNLIYSSDSLNIFSDISQYDSNFNTILKDLGALLLVPTSNTNTSIKDYTINISGTVAYDNGDVGSFSTVYSSNQGIVTLPGSDRHWQGALSMDDSALAIDSLFKIAYDNLLHQGYIVDGLVFLIDVDNKHSYPNAGVRLYGLVSGLNADYMDMINGATFKEDPRRVFFDGINDYLIKEQGSSTTFQHPNEYTITHWSRSAAVNSLEIGAYWSQGPAAALNGFGVGAVDVLELHTGYRRENLPLGRSYGIHHEGSNTSSSTVCTGDNSTPYTEWNQLTYSYGNRTVKLYSNGQLLVERQNTLIFIKIIADYFMFGRHENSSAGRNFSGDLASLAIYNRALSDEEVLTNYKNTAWRFT